MYSCIPPQIIRGQIHNISDYPNFHGDAKPSERCCILASQEFFSKQKVQIPKCFVCDENIFCKVLRSSRKNMHFIFIDIDCHHRCHVIFKKWSKSLLWYNQYCDNKREQLKSSKPKMSNHDEGGMNYHIITNIWWHFASFSECHAHC